MPSVHQTYETAAITLADEFTKQIHACAPGLNVLPDALLRAVVCEMLGEEKLTDGRAHNWRVRVRVYDCRTPDEVEADSDDALEADQPGSTIIKGMPKMIKWVIKVVSSYHGAPCTGLEERTLQRKLRSLRTMLSNRGDGTGDFRANYEVIVNGEARYMIVRVDVCRADPVDDKPSRRLPGGYSTKSPSGG